MDPRIQAFEEQFLRNDLPRFGAGDTVVVYYKIREGNKERIQPFEGIVLQRRGRGASETVTVRKVSHGVGVERIFPIHSPLIEKIEVKRYGRVRRARIFYIRNIKGKIKIREHPNKYGEAGGK